MPTDDLDDRIHSLVSHAVAAAPPAPPLDPSAQAAVVPLAPRPSRRPLVWAAAGVAAAALVVGIVLVNDDSPGRITTTNTTTATTETTVSSTTSTDPNTQIAAAWPDDVVGVIASERGVELVWAEGDGAAIQKAQSAPQRPLDRALQTYDGQIFAGGSLMDIGLNGERFDAIELDDGTPWVAINDLAGNPIRDLVLDGEVDGGITRLTHGSQQISVPGAEPMGDAHDMYVGEVTDANGFWSPIYIAANNSGEGSDPNVGSIQTGLFENLGVAGPHDPGGDPPRLFTVSAGGDTIAWIQGGSLYFSDGTAVEMPDGSKPMDLDIVGDYVAVSRASTPGQLYDMRTGQWWTAPVNGHLSISFAPVSSVTTPDTTPQTVPTTTAPTIPAGTHPIITAGEDGVWEYPDGVAAVDVYTDATDDFPVHWTDELMAIAVRAPDGSIIMQRAVEFGTGSGIDLPNATFADSVPLIQRQPSGPIESLFEVLMPAADPVAGWYRIHDVARVDGRDVLLLERQEAESSGVETPSGVLMTLDLGTGALETIDDNFGGWENGSSRLHLAENGLVVGEIYSGITRGFYSVSVGAAEPLTAAELGFAESYDDCVDCPGRFTISKDGTVLGWIEGLDLVRRSLVTGEVLGTVSGNDWSLVSDVSLAGDTFYVLEFVNYGDAGQPTAHYEDGRWVALNGRRVSVG